MTKTKTIIQAKLKHLKKCINIKNDNIIIKLIQNMNKYDNYYKCIIVNNTKITVFFFFLLPF